MKLLNLGSPKKQKARQIAAPLLSVVILLKSENWELTSYSFSKNSQPEHEI